RTRLGFRWSSLPIALGVHLGDDVVDLLLYLGDHFAGFLSHLVGAANGRSNQRIYRAPICGRYFGTSIVATPSTRPGRRAASKIMTPAPTTATVAAVATNSSWPSVGSSKPSVASSTCLSAILPSIKPSDLCRSMQFPASGLERDAAPRRRAISQS